MKPVMFFRNSFQKMFNIRSVLTGKSRNSIMKNGSWLSALPIFSIIILVSCAQQDTLPTELPSLTISEERLIEAKKALQAFGYNPGDINGDWNIQAFHAALEFQNDVPGSGDSVFDRKMFKALGIDDFDGKHRAEIFVIDERASALAEKLTHMNRTELIIYLKDLARHDKKKIDLVFSRPKSIVFVIFKPLSPGDKIRTYASNIIEGKRNRWSQSYTYRVTDSTPTQPMVIINEFETGNPMYLVHHVFINGERVDARVTRAAR